MKKCVSRALWCALLAGGLTVLGATAANAAESGGEDGLASGNQVLSSITAPVTVEGDAISVLGDSSSGGTSTGPAVVTDSGDSDSAVTDGEDGVASGNQVWPDVTAPVALEGNAISVLGDSSSEGTSTAPAVVTGDDDEGFLGVGDDDEGFLGLDNDDEGFLQLGFTSEVRAVVDGNVADERAGNNAKEERTTAVVIRGTSAGSADGETAAEGDLSTQALAATGADAGNGVTAAALMLGAGLTLTTVARRKSLRL